MEILHEATSIDMRFNKSAWKKGDLPFHWHEKLEIVIPLDKPFGVLIDGVSYEIGRGDIAVISERIIHSFTINENDTNIIVGQFPYRILLNNSVVPTAVKTVIFADEIEKDAVFANQLKKIFDVMLSEQTVMVGEKNPFLQSMYSALYFLIMRKFSVSEKSKVKKSEKQDFYKIVNFANEHFSQSINVQSVAQSLYMGRERMSKIFSKYSGMTLNHYINTLRVKKAMQLIEQGETKTYAALESGFQSVRTFNDFCKKMHQENPAD